MKRSVFIVGVGLVLLATALFAWLNLVGGKRTFEVKGRVAGFGGERAVYVEHGEVSGYLPARTTPFRAQRAGQIDSLDMGDAVSFTLTATPDSSWITNVEKLPDNAVPRNPAAIAKKQTDSALLETGEQVPDVELVDQDGRAVRLSDYRGKALVLTFIYTDCPLPNFCPLMSKQFAALQPKLRKAFGDKAQLLSISFDPENDTPEVLTDYAKKYTDDTDTWTFATGATPAQLEKAKQAFGITTIERQGEIVHNLVTALIGPDGKLVWTWRGNEWTPRDILQVASQTLNDGKQAAAPVK